MKLYVLSLASTLVLAGCGGGGSSDNTSSQPIKTPYSFTLSKTSIDLAENSSTTLTISAQGANSPSYSFESTDSTVTADIANNTITINASEVDKATEATMTITGQQGNDSKQQTVSVSVSNNSADILIQEVEKLSEHQESIMQLADEKALFEFVNVLAFQSGKQSHSEMTSSQNNFYNDQRTGEDNLSSLFDDIKNEISTYQGGDVSDKALITSNTNLKSAISTHVQTALDTINSKIALTQSLTEITTDGLHFSEQISAFSQFVGNTAIGKVENEQWVFTEDFSYLNGFLPSMTIGQVCPAASEE